MVESSFQFPNHETLRRGLTFVFNNNGGGRGRLTVLRREQGPYATSFPCEIVRCQFEDGGKVTLFCKYAAGDGGCSYGQRGGVGYEIQVYRRVLEPSQASAPTFYGSYTDRRTGSRWLVLEYLTRSTAAGKLGVRAMRAAARWIGRFHAMHEHRLATAPARFLTVYDAKYYRGWAERTVRFARRWHRRFPWLRTLCTRWEEAVEALVARPLTVIHGEYYPHNILVQRGQIRPVDWETAATAVGEIDLATLTEGWSREITRACQLEYLQARWPESPPTDFDGILDRARVYVQLRWLGDEPEWTNERSSVERFQMLQSAGKRLGLL